MWHALGWAVLATLLCALTCHAAWFWERTTDQVSYFLAGVEMAHGNWRLKGWVLTPPDFWTSDIPLSALLSLLSRAMGHPPVTPFLMELQPALMWTGLVASVVSLVRMRAGDAKRRVAATVLALTLFGIPLLSVETAYFVTLSAIHLGTIIYALWALHHAARFLETGETRRLLLSGLLFLLGALGDPLLQFVGTAPVMLYSLMRLYSARNGWSRRHMALLATIAVAAAGAPLLLLLNRATGGFEVEGLSPGFVAWRDLGRNFILSLRDILLAFGADPTGLSVMKALPQLLRLMLLAWCAWSLLSVLRRRLVRQGADRLAGEDPFLSLLLLVSLFNCLSLMVSSRAGLEGFSIATVRYLFPLWACLSIVIAIVCAGRAVIVGLAVLVLIVTVVVDVSYIGRPAPDFLYREKRAVVEALLEDGASIGVGTWWSSRSLELMAPGSFFIIPAATDAEGRISPMQHIHPHLTFDALKDQPFFVVLPTPAETFDEKAVLCSFGPPERRREVGAYRIFHYAKLDPARVTQPCRP